jgi:hypothetical protein
MGIVLGCCGFDDGMRELQPEAHIVTREKSQNQFLEIQKGPDKPSKLTALLERQHSSFQITPDVESDTSPNDNVFLQEHGEEKEPVMGGSRFQSESEDEGGIDGEADSSDDS